MSDLAYLDELSNSELRKKCLQYKLPNVPITDTSRKLMVRRLHSAMLGIPYQSLTTPKSKRRVTMPSTKTSSAPIPVEKSQTKAKENNNNKNSTRYTIGNTRNMMTTKTLSSSDIGSQSEGEDFNNKQFARDTFGNNRIVKTTTTLSSSDIGSQSEEEEVVNNYYKQPTVARDDQRLRRSVSLTKTGVLTTSYTQESSPLRNNKYKESDELDEINNKAGHFEAPKYSVYSNPLPDTHTLPTYVPTFEHKIKPNLYTQSNLTQTQLHSNSYGINPNNNLNANLFQPSTFSGSSAPFSYGNTHAPSILKHSSPKPVLRHKRRTTSSVASGSGQSLYPKLNDFYNQDAGDSVESNISEADTEDELMDVDEPEVEAPYSSKYTRTLLYGKSCNPVGVRRGQIHEDDVKASLGQFLTALERKYHLKQTFAIIMIVFLSIFLYVMLSP